jgi:hypothetical protein
MCGCRDRIFIWSFVKIITWNKCYYGGWTQGHNSTRILFFLDKEYRMSPCGVRLEYLHHSPASRRRRWKGNPLPGNITGSPCHWGTLVQGPLSAGWGLDASLTALLCKIKVKSKVGPVQVSPLRNKVSTTPWRRREEWMYVSKFSLYRLWRPLGLRKFQTPTFSDIRLIDGGKVVSPTRRPLFTPRKIPSTHFC